MIYGYAIFYVATLTNNQNYSVSVVLGNNVTVSVGYLPLHSDTAQIENYDIHCDSGSPITCQAVSVFDS